jgi:muramoyltetrapeptide carboxypeptidase
MSPSQISPIKPPALRPGDTVGIVAPASNIKRADLEAGCEGLRRAGYKPFYFDSIRDKDLYFAGSVERRVQELEAMFSRDDVRAIVCARGGYGGNYLLPAINLEIIRKHPKIFVAYSDITALLTYFDDVAGLVSFHGPMVNKDWGSVDGVDFASWQLLSEAALEGFEFGLNSGMTGLADGAGEGILYGGCLSILAASLGTRYEIKTESKILFLEDVAEKPFRIDRMLMQLKLAGKFDGVRGVIFGQMLNCIQIENQGYTLEEVVMRVVGSLEIPVAFGLRSGHVTGGNITLPIGVKAALTVSGGEARLKLLEAAVSV